MKRTALLGVWSAGVVAAALLAPGVAAAEPATGTELAGKTVFLDPGHQGTSHSENLGKQVDDGRGGTKDCQTTGMTTVNGVAEHTINWNVAKLVRSSLESLGATVVLSRDDDSGWGGCVDDRARAASASGADVAVSIHADSTSTGSDPGKRGFHLIVPTLPIHDAAANAAQSAGGRAASNAMRDAYTRAGFSPANYAGTVDGIQERSDVAGPALTSVPLVFVEMGNGSDPDDASVLESSEGQLKHAIALSTGVIDYLLGPDAGSAESSLESETPDVVAKSAAASVSPSTTASPSAGATVGESALSRVLAGIAPYIDSAGVDGLTDLVTEDNVGAVSTFAQGLLQQILAPE